MELALAMGLFFILITFIFIAVAVFLPEWLGITGNKAKEIIITHEESTELSKEKDSQNQSK